MWRRTERYPMDVTNGSTGLLAGEGAAIWRPTSGRIPADFLSWETSTPELMHSPPRDGVRAWEEGEEPQTPAGYGPRWLWEPRIISIAGQIYDVSVPVSTPNADPNVQFQAFFLDYDVFRVARETFGAVNTRGFVDAALSTTRKAQLISFRAGDVGRRVWYDPNFGKGHLPPRENVPETACIDQANGYWPLFLYWNRITDDSPNTDGTVYVDWEWSARTV